MIKFAALTPSLTQPGGAERTILIQLRYSDPARMQCTGIALSGYGGLDEALGRDLNRYSMIHGDPAKGRWRRPELSMVNTAYSTLKDAVLHVCQEAGVLITWGSLVMGRFTSELTIPVICVSHCSDVSKSDVGGITHLVAVSESARQFFASAPGAAGLPVEIIPNGVEVDRVCPRRGRSWQREQWGVSATDKILLYLGRQAAEKNPSACIRALAELPANYKLIMIGNQSYTPDQPNPDVAKLVDALDLRDRVQFLPPIPFVGDVLAGADCLLHLSLREADSLVVKEAFLAELPVVHTPVGSIPEMEAEFGQVGWGVSFRPGELNPESIDPYEVADQVALAVRKDMRTVITKMRAIAWEHWTGTAMCDRWANYLEKVVAGWTYPSKDQPL